MACSCCGEEREVVALRARDDVQLCRDCLGWLAGQLGVISTPTLPVTGLPDAIAFYERAAALPVTPIADQPWGMREFTLTYPSGNDVRIGQPLG